MIKYLTHRYQLKSKFQDGSVFLKDHYFVTRRFFNETDFCEVLAEDNNHFCLKFKLCKPRKKSIFLNNKLDTNFIYFKPELHFEFVVDSEKFE